MIDKFCMFLLNKMRKDNKDIDDQKAEVIYFGLQNIIGEIPKIFILIGIAFLLGVGELALLSYLLILPYRFFSGGFHLKTHLGCIISTTIMYCGNVYLAKYIPLETEYIKYLAIIIVYIFGIIMVHLYAPADTENVPILSKKDRKNKRKFSYITLTISLLVALVINNALISSLIIYGMFIQTLTITKVVYRLTNNKYGYEVYNISNTNIV